MFMERDDLFDNIKGLLIFLTVLGHFLQIGLRDSVPFFKWIWVIIYSFHMPVFIFISGYFSRNYQRERGKKAHRLMFYYILGECLVCLAKSIFSHRAVLPDFLSPSFGMWYLLCLFFFDLLLPWAMGVRWNLGVSMILAVLAGQADRIGPVLALSRTICMMPFFLLGVLLSDREKIRKLRHMTVWKKTLVITVWALVFLNFLAVMAKNGMNYDIVWAKGSYARGGMEAFDGMAARICFFLSAFCTGLVLFMVMTEKKCFLSQWGKNSLSVYMLHLPLFYLVSYFFKYIFPWDQVWAAGVTVMAVSAGAVWILSRDCIYGAMRKLEELMMIFTWKGRENEQK